MREPLAAGEKANRGLPVDPSLPRWVCQNCRHSLCVVGVDSYADKFFPSDPSLSGMMQASVLGLSRMDQSYVVLPKHKPPRPSSSKSSAAAAIAAARASMEESFVVLPPAAASMYKSDSTAASNATSVTDLTGDNTASSSSRGATDGGEQIQPGNAGFHASIAVLSRAFEIAAAQTQVEQPLCLECLRVLSDKLDKEVEDVTRDIKAYEACLQRSELESYKVLADEDFLKEKKKLEEEERKLQAAIEEMESQFSEVNAEKADLESKSKHFKDLEERYWHEFNNFHFQLISHQEERDAILAKIEASQAHLELLKGTNVLNDAFHISHEGDFGTINNFRLGRLPKIPVEWDEINAAWGQACLLLHTMAQYFRPEFQYRIKILPMGSYPRIMDTSNNTYDLFGPVNLFWSTRYDKAMTLFLTCLKEFAEFANLKDQDNNIPPEKRLKLPYRIENDKVESYTITQSFNKQENWTKALKYTLCNLKWMLYWFVGNTSFQPISAMTSPKSEVSSIGPLSAKRSANRKA